MSKIMSSPSLQNVYIFSLRHLSIAYSSFINWKLGILIEIIKFIPKKKAHTGTVFDLKFDADATNFYTISSDKKFFKYDLSLRDVIIIFMEKQKIKFGFLKYS